MESILNSLRGVCLVSIFSILGCSSADVPESLWKNPEEVSNYTPGVRRLVFSPTGEYLASLNMPLHPWNMRVSSMFSTPQLNIWTIPEDYLWPRSLMSRELEFFHMAFDEREEHLLTDAKGGVWQYDLTENTSDFAPLKSERVLAFSRDGRLAVLKDDEEFELSELEKIHNDDDRSVRIKNVETGQVISTLELPKLGTLPIFSPDSRFLLMSGGSVSDEKAHLFEVSTGELLLKIPVGNLNYPISLATSHSADSLTGARQIMMAAHEGPFVGVWSLDTGKLVQEFASGWEEVWHVALSPDGKFLAVSGESELKNKERHGLVRFWNLDTGEELEPIEDDSTWGITAVAYSPDGKRLATGDGDGKIKLWPLPEKMRSSAKSD